MKNLIRQLKMKPINKLFFAAMTLDCVAILIVIISIFFAACSDANRSGEQDKKASHSLGKAGVDSTLARANLTDTYIALQLLGKANGGSIKVGCNAVTLIKASEIFSDSLVDKNIADNLFETARKINNLTKDCTESGAWFMVTQNPTIDQIIQILGKEDSIEVWQLESTEGNKSTNLYKFNWLGFGVSDGKVILMKIDFKKSGL